MNFLLLESFELKSFISIACYVSNLVFLDKKLLKNIYELWFEHMPTISHFRVFWCKCFALKSKNLNKFEARTTDGIFLGYSTHSCDYCILDLETNKIFKTCEVTFNETS